MPENDHFDEFDEHFQVHRHDDDPALTAMVTLLGRKGTKEEYGIVLSTRNMTTDMVLVGLGHLLRTILDETGADPLRALKLITGTVRYGTRHPKRDVTVESESEMLKRLQKHRLEGSE